jgi:outer membrane protein OmpA-like peptidoglycan-associated protein
MFGATFIAGQSPAFFWRMKMLTRRQVAVAAIALLAFPGIAVAQDAMPSAAQIERQLDAGPRVKLRPDQKVTVREFKRRPELRRMAPSIDIQSINFAFGSAVIPREEFRKVRQIARAMQQILRRRRNARFLIEGHTDAVGSDYSNQILSERRAESLKWLLVQEFGVQAYALETVGYGEQYLLVPTQYEEWRNRRVTLRRIDEFVR